MLQWDKEGFIVFRFLKRLTGREVAKTFQSREDIVRYVRAAEQHSQESPRGTCYLILGRTESPGLPEALRAAHFHPAHARRIVRAARRENLIIGLLHRERAELLAELMKAKDSDISLTVTCI